MRHKIITCWVKEARQKLSTYYMILLTFILEKNKLTYSDRNKTSGGQGTGWGDCKGARGYFSGWEICSWSQFWCWFHKRTHLSKPTRLHTSNVCGGLSTLPQQLIFLKKESEVGKEGEKRGWVSRDRTGSTWRTTDTEDRKPHRKTTEKKRWNNSPFRKRSTLRQWALSLHLLCGGEPLSR